MKRLLQLFLAGVFLLSFSAQAGVTSPNGIAKWSGGSSVWLAWTSAGDRVDIRLIPKGSGQEPREIATDIKNTGYYLWQIPDLPKDQYTVEIIGNKTDKSAVFNISAWVANKDLGAFDENDRSQVTYPLEAAVLDKDEPITLTWDDFLSFLGDKVTITLKKQGETANVEVERNLPNSGTFDFDKDQITACQKGGCYFVIQNSQEKSQQISSHTFTFGTPVTDVFTVEKPEDVTAGEELNIGWTGGTDGHRVRIDLNKGGLFYQTIKESAEALELDNKYAWPVSLSVLKGKDYAVVVTALADGSSGTSDLFTIKSDKGNIKVTPPGTLKVKNKRSRKGLKWKGIKAAVDIDLYRDGRRFRAIKRDQSKKLFRWTYGDIPIGDNYQIRITQTDDDSVYGISAPFAIAAPSASDRQTARLGKDCKRLGITGKCTYEAIEQVEVLCQNYGIELRSCTMQEAEEGLDRRIKQILDEVDLVRSAKHLFEEAMPTSSPEIIVTTTVCKGLGISEDECSLTKIKENLSRLTSFQDKAKIFDYLISHVNGLCIGLRDSDCVERTRRGLELARDSSGNGLLLCKVSPDRADLPFCNEEKSASKVDWDKWSTGPGNELLQDIEKYYGSTVRFDVGD